LVCGEKADSISERLGVCLKCIRNEPEEALDITRGVHAKSRAVFGLPPELPKDVGGLFDMW
jgi:pyruvate formate lyase activating enzyme